MVKLFNMGGGWLWCIWDMNPESLDPDVAKKSLAPYITIPSFLVAFEDTGWKLQLFSDSSLKDGSFNPGGFRDGNGIPPCGKTCCAGQTVTSHKNEIFIDHECSLTGVTCPTFIQEVECVTSCPVFHRYPSLARHRRRKKAPGIPVKDFSIQDDLRD